MIPLRERHLAILAITFVLVASLPYLLELNHPRYSFIGDEWGFYERAKSVVAQRFMINPLSSGVYVVNSMFAQMIQALPMALLGVHVWVWKLSGVLSVYAATILIFIWARMWFGPLVGLFSAIAFGASSYAWNFSLIGYVNMQGVVHLIFLHVLLTKLVLSERTRKSVSISLLIGLVAGLSFFEFGGLAYPLVLSPYLLACFNRELRPQLFRAFALIVCVGVLLALPGLLNDPLRNGLFGQANFQAHPLSTFERLQHGFEYLVSFASMKGRSHYAFGPYVDAATRVGVVIGLIAAITVLRKFRSTLPISRRDYGALVILTCTILAAFVYGFTSPYPEPPRTRGIFMLPHFALLAGIGFGRVAETLRAKHTVYFIVALACGTIFLNLIRRHQFFTLMGVTADSCITWHIRNARKARPSLTTVYLQHQSSPPGRPPSDDVLAKTARVNDLLKNYEISGVEVVPATPSTVVAAEESAILDLATVYSTGCRDLAVNELPWYARGFGASARSW